MTLNLNRAQSLQAIATAWKEHKQLESLPPWRSVEEMRAEISAPRQYSLNEILLWVRQGCPETPETKYRKRSIQDEIWNMAWNQVESEGCANLSVIGGLLGISRQAVHQSINRTAKKKNVAKPRVQSGRRRSQSQ